MFLLLHVAHAKKKTAFYYSNLFYFIGTELGFRLMFLDNLKSMCTWIATHMVIHLIANTFPVTLLPALMICSSEGGQNWGQQKIAAWESQVICIQDTEARYLQTKSKSTIFFQYSVLKITHLKTKQNKSLWLRHTI